MVGFRLVEFYAEGGDSGGVDGIGLGVELDPQFAALHIGAQVDCCLQESAHEAADVIGAVERFTGNVR